MKFTTVIIKSDFYNVNEIELPAKEIPITLEFDDKRPIGSAKLRKENGNLIADITLSKGFDLGENSFFSIGGEYFGDKKIMKPNCLGGFTK